VGGRFIDPGFRRYELKFRLPRDAEDDIRDALRRRLVPDPHCARCAARGYTVHSIYLDTDDLRFYFEKVDGFRVRRKLRIRAYGERPGEAPAFLEIKRKDGRRGAKERLSLPLADVDHALNGKDPAEVLAGRSWSERKILERFRFNLKAIDLHPTVLVSYERQAWIDPDDERSRVTFDRDLRSLWHPALPQLFEERGACRFDPGHFVLEMKFDGRMPRWMCDVVRRFDLDARPYSKYCHGIYAWRPHDVRRAPPGGPAA